MEQEQKSLTLNNSTFASNSGELDVQTPVLFCRSIRCSSQYART